MSTIEFKNAGTFQALYAAQDWLKARGFSVGSSQAGAPSAIWHGDCLISKWRNLSTQEKREVHAIMEGEFREGPVRIVLMSGATDAARTAFALTDDELSSHTAAQAAAQQATPDLPVGAEPNLKGTRARARQLLANEERRAQDGGAE